MARNALRFAAAFAAAGIACGAASAQEMKLTCINAGNIYSVGEFACIAACHGARQLARCDQIADATTWTYVSDVCPSAHFVPPPPDNASQVPVVTSMSRLPGPLKISEFSPVIKLRIAAARLDTRKAQ